MFKKNLSSCTGSIWKKTKESKVCIISRRGPCSASHVPLTKAKYHLSCRQDLFANLAQCHQEVASDKLAVRLGLLCLCAKCISVNQKIWHREEVVSVCLACITVDRKVGKERESCLPLHSIEREHAFNSLHSQTQHPFSCLLSQSTLWSY